MNAPAPRALLVLVSLAAGAAAQARTHKIVNSFPNPHGTSYASGLAYARGELWLSSGLGSTTIHRVDAYTGASLGTIPAPTASLRGLTHDGGFLWAASWNDNRVYQLLDVTGFVISSFPAFTTPAHPDGLAWDGANLLISNEANQIHWFTPTGTQLGNVTVPASGSFNPRDLGWDGKNIWAGYQSTGRIRKHDATTGAVLLDIASPCGNFQQGLEWADWHLWATGGTNSQVYQIDVGPPFVELSGTMAFPNSIQFRVTDAQAQAGNLAVVLLSLSGTAGFSLGGFTIPITIDALTQFSLNALPLFSAMVDPAGLAQTPLFQVPPLSPGVTFWAAGVTLNGFVITAVTDPIRFKSQ